MSIKFKREKRTIGYSEDTIYIFEATKHLPKGYVHKDGYSWTLRREDNNERIKYDVGRSMKAAKAYVESYDEMMDNTIAKEKAAEEKRISELEERYAREQKFLEAYKKPVSNPVRVEVGEFIKAKFASLNKNSHIGEYASECAMPELREESRYWDYQNRKYVVPTNWDIQDCKVECILELSDEEYDIYIENLMGEMPRKEFHTGGTSSTEFENDDREFWNLSEVEQELFRATRYAHVNVIIAPNRKSFVTDNQGYEYARYVGLDIVKN